MPEKHLRVFEREQKRARTLQRKSRMKETYSFLSTSPIRSYNSQSSMSIQRFRKAPIALMKTKHSSKYKTRSETFREPEYTSVSYWSRAGTRTCEEKQMTSLDSMVSLFENLSAPDREHSNLQRRSTLQVSHTRRSNNSSDAELMCVLYTIPLRRRAIQVSSSIIQRSSSNTHSNESTSSTSR